MTSYAHVPDGPEEATGERRALDSFFAEAGDSPVEEAGSDSLAGRARSLTERPSFATDDAGLTPRLTCVSAEGRV